jgi:hypothetical protein
MLKCQVAVGASKYSSHALKAILRALVAVISMGISSAPIQVLRPDRRQRRLVQRLAGGAASDMGRRRVGSIRSAARCSRSGLIPGPVLPRYRNSQHRGRHGTAVIVGRDVKLGYSAKVRTITSAPRSIITLMLSARVSGRISAIQTIRLPCSCGNTCMEAW